MNRWLTRKKDGGEDALGGKKGKKGKKNQEEVKPEFNLNAALPKVDDFRTSLIMPGLSTRFSMLREQDDPSSKIGKASDDSVLQPKRQSRLHEFGFVPGGLSDIAEVQSINGSIRPPFANERSSSFDSSRDDDNSGSVMSRARPGEGNVLFGGRQKIYMISNNSTKGLGRTLYDDDVNMSSYQRLRLEEKEKLRLQTEDTMGQRSEPSSPSRSLRRETSSSTTSAAPDARISTAATSVASQGANSITATSPSVSSFVGRSTSPEMGRSGNKPRRLYDQGLDQHIQDQQSSAMNRLNTIQKTRAPTGRSTPPVLLPQGRSATNLSDRFNRSPVVRTDSPNQFGFPAASRNNSSAGSSPVLTRPQSPPLVSPVLSESEEAQTLNAALEPNDRGKATAMGAFNKPKESFSEEQYAERLRQMQQEFGGRKASVPKEDRPQPRKPTLRERAELERQKRVEAETSRQQQSSESSAEPSPAQAAFSRFQAAASQMKAPTSPLPPCPQERTNSPPKAAAKGSFRERTFFTSPDSSDVDEDVPKPLARRFENLPVATGPAPSLFDHPALRSRSASEDKVSPVASADNTNQRVPQISSPRPDDAEVDSPTLGPDNGGLSGLIRQHLRNVSNVSSNYDEPEGMTSPPGGLMIQTQDISLQHRQPGSETVTPAPSTYSHSNPWDLDDMSNASRDERGSLSSVSPIDHSKVTPLIMSATEPNKGSPWDLASRRTHERMASNESEAEHEAFQRDLAQRQRLIQENLRARAEGRSTSPAPAASGGLKNALNMLRAKSSRESFAVVERPQELPARSRKLTLGGGSTNVSSTSLVGLQGGDAHSLKAKPSRVLQQSEQDAQREFENRKRSGTDSSRTGRSTGRSGQSTGQSTTRSSTRERSGSTTSSNRSRSRPDLYRDDLEQAMLEGSRTAYPASTLPSLPGYVANPTPPLPPARPSEDSQGRMRSRSNSQAAHSAYFDSKHLQPGQTVTPPGSISPRLPVPQSKLPSGAPLSPRPSPGGFSGNGFSQPTSPMAPFSANHTPPVSNPSTPNTTAFPGAASAPPRHGMLRKKSVAKVDISEPVFISTTSSIDLVDLPPGASLKNGADGAAPPVPPINPMRRRFGFARGDAMSPPPEPTVQAGPGAPYAEAPRNRLRKASSEGKSLREPVQPPTGVSPAMPPAGFANRHDSPPRPINREPIVQQAMDGAMF